jgi:hypothetical protein
MVAVFDAKVKKKPIASFHCPSFEEKQYYPGRYNPGNLFVSLCIDNQYLL